MELSGAQYPIAAGGLSAVITGIGGALRRFTDDGRDVTCSWPDGLQPKCCGGVLMPWPNRIDGGRWSLDGSEQQLALTEPENGNAIHGLGRWDRWQAAERSDDAVTMTLDVVPQKGYPFLLAVSVRYALHPTDGLTVTLSARNEGDARAPLGAGAHPYLAARGALDDLTLTLPAATAIDADERGIPQGTHPVRGEEDFRVPERLGQRRFDQGFTDVERAADGYAVAELQRADGSGARLWFDASFGYMQVYTLDAITRGQAGVAIEPMTCAANAFNSGDGLRWLEPGAEWRGEFGITPITA